ncbi:hypothetical protein B0O80DRAFT_490763 [Mortierella sp. GBAus27b]|nr:hypothetical protein B0O80DRAFT_490763 [Mortierella sp. GBAus27b]
MSLLLLTFQWFLTMLGRLQIHSPWSRDSEFRSTALSWTNYRYEYTHRNEFELLSDHTWTPRSSSKASMHWLVCDSLTYMYMSGGYDLASRRSGELIFCSFDGRARLSVSGAAPQWREKERKRLWSVLCDEQITDQHIFSSVRTYFLYVHLLFFLVDPLLHAFKHSEGKGLMRRGEAFCLGPITIHSLPLPRNLLPPRNDQFLTFATYPKQVIRGYQTHDLTLVLPQECMFFKGVCEALDVAHLFLSSLSYLLPTFVHIPLKRYSPHPSVTMANLRLFCLVEGDPSSRAFEVEIPRTCIVSFLKDLTKTKQAPEFDDIDANELTLWKVVSTPQTPSLVLSGDRPSDDPSSDDPSSDDTSSDDSSSGAPSCDDRSSNDPYSRAKSAAYSPLSKDGEAEENLLQRAFRNPPLQIPVAPPTHD